MNFNISAVVVFEAMFIMIQSSYVFVTEQDRVGYDIKLQEKGTSDINWNTCNSFQKKQRIKNGTETFAISVLSL